MTNQIMKLAYAYADSTHAINDTASMDKARAALLAEVERVSKDAEKLRDALIGLLKISNGSCVGPWEIAREALGEKS